MANLTTVQICPAQEVEGIDECSENIPPGVIAVPGTSTLKDQDGDVSGCSSAHQSGENDPHYAFSTPAPTSQNSKMGLSGFHSALTPVLKQLNIQNKYSSSPSHGITNSWSITRSNQPSDTDIAGACSRRFLGDVNAPVCWLTDECLPEVSFLDVTCDTTLQLSKNNSALPDSMPSPPVTTGFVHTVNTPKTFISKKPDVIHCGISKKPVSVYKGKQTREGTVSETSSNKHQTPQHNHTSKLFNVTEEHSQVAGEIVSGKGNMVVDVPESIDAPLRWLDDRYFPEITLLDVTHDSEFSPKAEIPSLEVMQDIPVSGVQSDLPSSALDRKVEAEPGTQNTDDAKELLSMLDANVIDTTRSLCEQSDKCVPKSTPNISFEVTRDISMKSALEDSQPSLVSSGQCVAKIQTSLEGMPGVHPVNVTRDISSSGDMSVSCAASHTAECNSGSQNTTSEALFDLGATSANVTGNSQELLKSQLTSKLSEDSPKPTRSVNGTFTVAPQSNQNTPSPVNTTAEILGPQNKTLDLPPLIGCSSKAQKDVNGQPGMESQNTNKSSLVSVNNTSCGVPIDTQNTTFEKLQKSTGSAISGEDGANNSSQNNTFTVKLSGENGTITMSETSSSDSQRSALDGPSPQKIYNSAKSPKQGCVETPPPVTNKQYETAVALSDTRTLNNHETESNLAVEVAFTDAQLETKDHSNSSLPMKDGSFDPSGHHSLETDERKDNTFNLDDTLDLRGHSLITSTPMVTLKMFNFSTEREEGKSVMAAQKKLYKDSPSQSNHPVQAEVPSNTAAKSLLPSLKTTSQLLRYKPASTLPGCPEPSVSGLPVTRQKRQAAALRNTGPPQVVGYETDELKSITVCVCDILFCCVFRPLENLYPTTCTQQQVVWCCIIQ